MAPENTTLEKKQEETYNDHLCDYEFICEGGGATSEKSGKLGVKKPGISLHFLRFGLFNKDRKEEAMVASSQSGESELPPKEVNVPGIPDLTQFYTSYTGLNAGWLYLIDENDPNLWYEYWVDGSGGYDPVYWKDNKDDQGSYKDIREASGDRNREIIVEKDAVLWAAYSPVQWSVDYHKSMRDDGQKRKERMTKITCSGFKKGASGDKFFQPYDKTRATFSEDPRDPQPIHHQMNGALKQILADEKAQDEDPTNDNTLREDMFVTLHDPMGCMQDVNEQLAQSILEFQALVEAIQTGETREEAYNRLADGNFDPPEPKKEYGELISLALTCYTMVYNDDEKIEQYDGTDQVVKYTRKGIEYESTKTKYGLDRKKVEGILGKKEREQCRKKMKKLRDSFGTLLKDPYCRSTLDDYLHNLPEQHLAGRAGILAMLGNLHTGIYDLDRAFLLRKEISGDTDRWKQFVWSLCDKNRPCKELTKGQASQASGYEGEDPLRALLTSKLNVDKLVGSREQLNANLAMIITKKLAFHAEQFDEELNQGRLTWRAMVRRNRKIVKRINNNIVIYEEELVTVRSGEIQFRLGEIGVDLDGAYLNLTATSAETRIREAVAGNSQTQVFVQARVQTPSRAELNANKFNQKAAKILNSRAFTGALSVIQILNFRAAMVKLVNDPKWKNLANVVGVSAELTEAVGLFQQAYIKSMGKSISKRAATFLETTIFRAGIIGGAVSSILCFWDAIQAFDKSDMDAALAFAGAGVAFALTVYFVAGPVGWIAGAIALGLFALASLLTDTKLQTYFKNFLLSDQVSLPKAGGESPMAYSRKVLQKKTFLMQHSSQVNGLMDPGEAEATLYELILLQQLRIIPAVDLNKHYDNIETTGIPAHALTVQLQYMPMLNRPDQLEARAWLFPDGMRRSQAKPLKSPNAGWGRNAEGQRVIEVRLEIPARYRPHLNQHATMVIALRTSIGGTRAMSHPAGRDGDARWLGIRFQLQSIRTIQRLEADNYITNKKVQIAPLNTLKENRRIWTR